jgi:hypothetical protein
VGDDEQLGRWRYESLVWCLRWLAAEPEATLAAEPRVGPDEIALSLEDVLVIGPLTGVVEEPVVSMVLAIDSVFEAMSGDGTEDNWTAEAVRSSVAWAAQRERARAVLRVLGEERDDAGLRGRV